MKIVAPLSSITSEAALAAVVAAVSHGRAQGAAVVAAVVDAGGNLMASLRADGAYAASVSIARDKAWTSATFGLPSDALGAAVSGNENLRDGIALRPGVVLFAGGLPIVVEGQIAGAIGVSGGSEDDDRNCAQAGLFALGVDQKEIAG